MLPRNLINFSPLIQRKRIKWGVVGHLSKTYLPICLHQVCISINTRWLSGSREIKGRDRKITNFTPTLSLHSACKGQSDLGAAFPVTWEVTQKGHAWLGWRIRGNLREGQWQVLCLDENGHLPLADPHSVISFCAVSFSPTLHKHLEVEEFSCLKHWISKSSPLVHKRQVFLVLPSKDSLYNLFLWPQNTHSI